MRLTKVQKATLDKLKAGYRIRTDITGYFWPGGKRVRYATVEALQKTGLLKQVEVQGRYNKSRYLVCASNTTFAIDLELANDIFDILVETCDASEGWRANFLHIMTTGCQEYRFQGNLGFGGKLYNNSSKLYVDCYPEDLTEVRQQAIDLANSRIKALTNNAS
jgi:hypothetical protein